MRVARTIGVRAIDGRAATNAKSGVGGRRRSVLPIAAALSIFATSTLVNVLVASHASAASTELYSWGYNVDGQLGNGTTTNAGDAGEGVAPRRGHRHRGRGRWRPQPWPSAPTASSTPGASTPTASSATGPRQLLDAGGGVDAGRRDRHCRVRRRVPQRGAGLERQRLRLGLQRVRPARQRHHQRCAFTDQGDAPGRGDPDRRGRRAVHDRGARLQRRRLRLGRRRHGRARRRAGRSTSRLPIQVNVAGVTAIAAGGYHSLVISGGVGLRLRVRRPRPARRRRPHQRVHAGEGEPARPA